MNFGMNILIHSMEVEQNFVTRMLIALSLTLKPKIFLKIFLMMLRDKRLLLIGKNKKVAGLFKDELGGKVITEVVSLRPKTYAYLIDGYDDDYEKNKIINKKAKGTKKCVIK